MSLPGAGGRCGGGRPIRAWAPTSTGRPRPPLAKMVLSRGMCSCSCSVLVREKKKEKTQPEIGLMWPEGASALSTWRGSHVIITASCHDDDVGTCRRQASRRAGKASCPGLQGAEAAAMSGRARMAAFP